MTETIEVPLYIQNSYRWIGVFFYHIYTPIYQLFLVVVVVLSIKYTVASTMLILVKTYNKVVCQTKGYVE